MSNKHVNQEQQARSKTTPEFWHTRPKQEEGQNSPMLPNWRVIGFTILKAVIWVSRVVWLLIKIVYGEE